MARFDKKSVSNEKSNTIPEGTTMDATTDVFDDDFDTEIVEDTDTDADTDTDTDTVEADTNPEPEPDISNFIELVESLVIKDDSGEVAEVDSSAMLSVQLAYKALSRKEKSLAKNELGSRMEKAVMEDDDISLAKFYLDVSNRMTDAPKAERKTRETKIVDPTEAFVRLIAKLDLARALVKIPEGMDKAAIEARAGELFQTGAEDAQKDEQELVWVKQAISLSQPKSNRGGGNSDARVKGVRHSVANHLAEAFANVNPGESLTIDEIIEFKSEEYGDDKPTRQAVVAHLSSKKFQAASSVTVAETETGEPVLVKK